MAFKLLGVTDEITTCDCCGKTNLKCTVALEAEDGATVYYGRDCAGAALYGRKSAKNTDLVYSRATMIQRCKNVLPAVLKAISEGKNTSQEVEKTIPFGFSVSFGKYSDTGNKMPLRIYYNAWCIPGVELPPDAY